MGGGGFVLIDILICCLFDKDKNCLSLVAEGELARLCLVQIDVLTARIRDLCAILSPTAAEALAETRAIVANASVRTVHVAFIAKVARFVRI